MKIFYVKNRGEKHSHVKLSAKNLVQQEKKIARWQTEDVPFCML